MAKMHPTAWTVFCENYDSAIVDIDEGSIDIRQGEDVVRLSVEDIEPLRGALSAAEASFREQIE